MSIHNNGEFYCSMLAVYELAVKAIEARLPISLTFSTISYNTVDYPDFKRTFRG